MENPLSVHALRWCDAEQFRDAILTQGNSDSGAAALRVLIVEDEPLLAMMLIDIVEELGHVVAQTCADISGAMAAVSADGFDAAIIDLNLYGERADPVAARLAEMNIPFVIATGAADGADQLGALAVIPKPYRFEDIDKALATLNANLR